jgi:hypothetical protein
VTGLCLGKSLSIALMKVKLATCGPYSRTLRMRNRSGFARSSGLFSKYR